MVKPVDLNKALQSVTFLKGRTPQSDTSDTFADLAVYRDSGLYVGGFSGLSPWERHPADEIVQVLQGSAILSLDGGNDVENVDLHAGMIAIVPENTWHQFEAPEGVTLLTVTPQPTEHTDGLAPPSSR